jgi:hypothetical protein
MMSRRSQLGVLSIQLISLTTGCSSSGGKHTLTMTGGAGGQAGAIGSGGTVATGGGVGSGGDMGVGGAKDAAVVPDAGKASDAPLPADAVPAPLARPHRKPTVATS